MDSVGQQKERVLLPLFASYQRVSRAVAWGEIFGDDMADTL